MEAKADVGSKYSNNLSTKYFSIIDKYSKDFESLIILKGIFKKYFNHLL